MAKTHHKTTVAPTVDAAYSPNISARYAWSGVFVMKEPSCGGSREGNDIEEIVFGRPAVEEESSGKRRVPNAWYI